MSSLEQMDDNLRYMKHFIPLNAQEMEAIRMINKTDKYRSDYYKYYTGGSVWNNPINYDICLNSGYLGRDKCVKIIKELYDEKKSV